MTTRNVPLNSSPATSTALPVKKNDALRIAQVGLAGGIGYAHINEIEKNPHFQMIGGYDLFPTQPQVAEALAKLQKRGGTIYSSFDQLLADPSVDAVDICAPHHFHRAMAVAAFHAGKHVLVEKPMATHPDDCAAMIAAMHASKKIGAVQMQHVGRSSMTSLRAALQSGAIGRIKEVFLSSLWWRTEEYYARIPWAGRLKIDGHWCVDGAFYNQCVHYVNQMLTLLSPGELPSVASVKNIRANLYKFHDAATLEAGDTAFVQATIDTPDAPQLTLVGTTCSTEDRHQIDILGENGRALWNGAGYLFVDNQPVQEFRDTQKEFDGNSRVFNSFYDAIRHGTTPITSFDQIAKVTTFINDCYEAAGWNIKKAPWSATQTLFTDTIERTRRLRQLPPHLSPAPPWS